MDVGRRLRDGDVVKRTSSVDCVKDSMGGPGTGPEERRERGWDTGVGVGTGVD